MCTIIPLQSSTTASLPEIEYIGDSQGVLYGRKSSNITIINSMVYNSTAEYSGGGVYTQEDSNINIEASNFTGNTADHGGVIYTYIRSTADSK